MLGLRHCNVMPRDVPWDMTMPPQTCLPMTATHMPGWPDAR